MPNRLAHETSPYLKQHAENPVDWYPWGKEALDRARQEDKPILLSIGYSACHWCHVMAHESFEDQETARLMNEHFVSIKIDREEMPDVDQIYQQALQLQGEHGGWPLTMFLDADAVPFFGGTYFPKNEGYGRPSFKRLLSGLAHAYSTDRQAVISNAAQFKNGLAQLARSGREKEALFDVAKTSSALDLAISRLASRIDRVEGGFQGAPKFPNPSALELLLRGAHRAHRSGGADPNELTSCVTRTLVKMAEGGIYDQLGGGFHRYSTDAHWLVPHFEKMLYDNAQLLTVYAHAFQITKNPLFARVMRETFQWIEREMRAPTSDGGGLFTAQDADSEGVEGKFFVWTPEEVGALAGSDAVAIFERCLGLTPGGNWHDPHGHAPPGASILHVTHAPNSEDEARAIETAKRTLFEARSKRIPPGTDDKILASSNGLAIAGLAEAGRVLGEDSFLSAAKRIADFVLGRMQDATGRLHRTYKAGQARLPGTLDDHAYLADGLIALYEATGEARWLEEALRLTALAINLFYDDGERAFYVTAADDPGLIERPVSTYDGAVPSGASVCLHNLIRLGDVTGNARWLEIAEQVLAAHFTRAVENPFGFSHLLSACDLFMTRPTAIVLAGPSDALARAVASVYLPNRVIARAENAPTSISALTSGKGAVDGKGAAYVCRNFTCERPVTDATALAGALELG